MVLIFSVLIGLALDFAGARPAEKYYASRYDHIDVEAILNNRRLVNYYAACLLSKGPCPPEGLDLKRILPEALQGNCGRCTEKQATVARRVLRRLQKEYPKVWFQLSEKWDPDDIYVRKFEASFGTKSGPFKPSKDKPVVLNSFDGDEDKSSDNNIDGSFSISTTTSHKESTTHRVLTTVTKTNNIQPSSTIATSTKIDSPYQPTTSLVSTTKTTAQLSTTTARSSTILTPSSSKLSTTVIEDSTISRRGTATSPRSITGSSLSTSTTRSSTTSSPSSTQPTTTSTLGSRTSTRQPIIPGFIPINTFFTNPPIPVRPLINLNIGANIGATVSGLVRGLGALGTRVIETGADIAEVVIKNFARPLQV